jgi:hypothetical protein
LTIIILTSVFTGLFYGAKQVMAQSVAGGATNNNNATTSSMDTAKTLVNDTIQSLQSGDIQGALVHLNLLKQQLTYSTGGPNAFPGIEVVNTLVSDAIKSLQHGNTNDALMHLNLVNRQLRNGMITTTTTKTQTTPIQQPTIAPTQGSPKTKSNTVGTTVSGKSPTPSSTPSLSPRTFSLDPSLLVSTKQQIVKNTLLSNECDHSMSPYLRLASLGIHLHKRKHLIDCLGFLYAVKLHYID